MSKDSLHGEDRPEPVYTYSLLDGYTAIYRSRKTYDALFRKYGFELVKERYLANEKMVVFNYCSVISLWRKKGSVTEETCP